MFLLLFKKMLESGKNLLKCRLWQVPLGLIIYGEWRSDFFEVIGILGSCFLIRQTSGCFCACRSVAVAAGRKWFGFCSTQTMCLCIRVFSIRTKLLGIEIATTQCFHMPID